MTHDTRDRLSSLRAQLTGELITPDDPDWDAARAPWNLSVDQRPVAIAVPAHVDDLRSVVRAAGEHGWGVTAQPHGHGASGSLEDCILIRPTRFQELSVDPQSRVARVGAGVDWGRVLAALHGTGLIALAGSNPEVSVVGYSLAGGHSAFSRAFGLAANAVEAVELLTADGRLVRVDAESDPDLFWALRGGCGLFGIVTAIEFRLFPVPSLDGLVYGGKLTFPGEAARDVLRAAIDVAGSLPDEVSIAAGLMHLPDVPFVPEPLRGRTIASVDVVSLAGAEATEHLIAPLRSAGPALADTIASFGVEQLPAVAAEPVDPVAAIDHGFVLSRLTTEVTDALVAGFEAGVPQGLSMLQLRPLGGAVARGSEHDGVAGRVEAAALAGTSVVGPPDMDHAAAEAALDHVLAAARPWEGRGLVASFLSHGDDLGRAYDSAAIQRLGTVKARIDPAGLIRSNRPLPG